MDLYILDTIKLQNGTRKTTPLVHGQLHDRVDDIAVILFERFDCFVSTTVGLLDDQIDIFIFDSVGVDLGVIVFLLFNDRFLKNFQKEL